MRLTINFLLKKARQKSNGDIPAYVRFTRNGKRDELSTGIFVHPDKWDDSGQQVKGITDNSRIINNRLDKIQMEILDIYNQLKSIKTLPGITISTFGVYLTWLFQFQWIIFRKTHIASSKLVWKKPIENISHLRSYLKSREKIFRLSG